MFTKEMLKNMFLELNTFVEIIYPGLSDQFLDNGFTLDSHI